MISDNERYGIVRALVADRRYSTAWLVARSIQHPDLREVAYTYVDADRVARVPYFADENAKRAWVARCSWHRAWRRTLDECPDHTTDTSDLIRGVVYHWPGNEDGSRWVGRTDAGTLWFAHDAGSYVDLCHAFDERQMR